MFRLFSGRQIVHKFIIALRAEIVRVLLCRDARPCILLGDAVARHDALAPHLFRRRYGDGRVADRAKAALDELDSIEADDLRVRRRHFLRQRARDALVHDGVELGELFSVLEDDQADGVDVHAAVLPKNDIAERLAQRAQQRLVIF